MTGRILPLLFLLLFLACTEKQQNIDIKSYYFPLDKMEGGMMFVYEYNNSLRPEFYWYLQTEGAKDSFYLNILELREDNSVEQKIREQIFPSGSMIIDYQVMEKDTNGYEATAELQIQSGISFPFEVEKDGGVYIFQVEWIFPSNPELKYTVVRNRRYAGDTTFLFKGSVVPAIVMHVKEILETEIIEDGRQTLEYEKIEVYAKGLGLAAKKLIVDGIVKSEYRLVDTFPGKLLIQED